MTNYATVASCKNLQMHEHDHECQTYLGENSNLFFLSNDNLDDIK